MTLKNLLPHLKRKHKILLFLLLALGTFLLWATMARSGLIYSFGMGFWGPNGHDGIWHLALIEQIFKSFPPPNPLMSGEVLTNYHFLYDALLAFISKITFIPPRFLYFQVFPFIFAFLLGFLSFLVGFYWKKDFWTGFYLGFLNLFAGSFGFLVTFAREGKIAGESLFWSMQSVSVLINPPFALSLVLILFLILFLLRENKWTTGKIVLVGILFGLLIDIKAYSGIIILPALFVFSLFRGKELKKIFLISLFVSLVTFFAINSKASSLFVFKPFWFIHTMIESTDKLNLSFLASARVNFIAQRKILKLFLVEGLGLTLFLIGNMGTRVVGLFSLLEKNLKKKLDEFDMFLIVAGSLGLVIPLLFIQKGTSWNTIQFFYYFLFFANFYAAEFLSKLTLSKKKISKIFLGLVILFTIPTTISSLRGYFGWPPPTAIDNQELKALNFLKKQPGKVVLSQPWDAYKKYAYEKTPLPINVYETTAYIPAFSGKQSFLADEMNLIISGYDFDKRLEEQKKFFESKDAVWQRGLLLNNAIDYIYLIKPENIGLEKTSLGLENIFENSRVVVYKVLK